MKSVVKQYDDGVQHFTIALNVAEASLYVRPNITQTSHIHNVLREAKSASPLTQPLINYTWKRAIQPEEYMVTHFQVYKKAKSSQRRQNLKQKRGHSNCAPCLRTEGLPCVPMLHGQWTQCWIVWDPKEHRDFYWRVTLATCTMDQIKVMKMCQLQSRWTH